jgi:hypothetical protein
VLKVTQGLQGQSYGEPFSPRAQSQGHSPMTKVTFTEKSDQVQLTDQDLEIVAGGTKPKHVKQQEFLVVKMTEVFITSV